MRALFASSMCVWSLQEAEKSVQSPEIVNRQLDATWVLNQVFSHFSSLNKEILFSLEGTYIDLLTRTGQDFQLSFIRKVILHTSLVYKRVVQTISN